MTWMPRAIVAADPRLATGCPSTKIRPLSGCSTPEMILMSVDFPQPFSPTRQWISPLRKVKSTPLSAWTRTKLLWIFSSRRNSSIAGRLTRGARRAKTRRANPSPPSARAGAGSEPGELVDVVLGDEQRPVVDQRIALDRQRLAERRDLEARADAALLAVEDGLGDVGHGVSGLGWIPQDGSAERTVLQVRRRLARGGGPDDRDLPDEPFLANGLRGTRRPLAAEAQECLYVGVAGDDVERRLPGQVLVLGSREARSCRLQLGVLLLGQLDGRVGPDVVRRDGQRADEDGVLARGAPHGLHHGLHGRLAEGLVVDHLDVVVGVLLVGRLVRDRDDLLRPGAREHGLDRFGVVGNHQDGVVALVDGVLDEPDLLGFVGGGRGLLADGDLVLVARLLEPALQPVEPGRPELRDRHHGVVLRHCRRSEQHRSYGCDDGQGPPRDFHTSSFRWYCCQARPPGRGDALACSDQANSPMTPSRFVWRRCISAI